MKKFDSNNDTMIEFGGIYYHLNFEAIDKLLSLDDIKSKSGTEVTKNEMYDENNTLIETEISTHTYEKNKEIDGSKYEILRMCLEIILMHNEASDDTLGSVRALKDTPISFKIAFNTLIKYNVLTVTESN